MRSKRRRVRPTDGNVERQPNLLKACKDLLRHVDRPWQIRKNPIFDKLRLRGIVVESDSASLRAAIENSLTRLTPLQRSIVTRTDLDGEKPTEVYASLNVSRRTFYRQRMSALSQVTCFLTSNQTTQIVVDEAEHFEALDLQLGLSRVLEQTGDWRRAADFLEVLAEASDVGITNFWLNLRLADVYIEAGRTSQGASKIRAARLLANEYDTDESTWHAMVAVFEAKAALANDQDAESATLLRDAVPKIRAYHASNTSRRVTETLVQGLLVRTEQAHGEGAFADAIACATEAEESCRFNRLGSSILSSRARMMVALSQVFAWREPIGAERELLHCYESAAAAGYMCETATIAAHLSGLYRISNRPREAYEITQKTLSAAQTLGPGVPLASVLIEWAYASFALKEYGEASYALEQAAAAASDSDGLRAVREALNAQLLLITGQYQAALLLAESAEQKFAKMGRTRFLGQALTVQAKALYALGHHRQALRVIRVAVEVLSTTGQPLIAAEAQRMLADPRRLAIKI